VDVSRPHWLRQPGIDQKGGSRLLGFRGASRTIHFAPSAWQRVRKARRLGLPGLAVAPQTMRVEKMAVPYEAAIHVTMTGNAMTGISALTAKIAEADMATKGLVYSLELLASGKLKSGIEKAFKTILDAGGNFQ
jgi:hypothetical protein